MGVGTRPRPAGGRAAPPQLREWRTRRTVIRNLDQAVPALRRRNGRRALGRSGTMVVVELGGPWSPGSIGSERASSPATGLRRLGGKPVRRAATVGHTRAASRRRVPLSVERVAPVATSTGRSRRLQSACRPAGTSRPSSTLMPRVRGSCRGRRSSWPGCAAARRRSEAARPALGQRTRPPGGGGLLPRPPARAPGKVDGDRRPVARTWPASSRAGGRARTHPGRHDYRLLGVPQTQKTVVKKGPSGLQWSQ